MDNSLHTSKNKTKCITIEQNKKSSYNCVNNNIENKQYYLDCNSFFPSQSPPNYFLKTLEKRYKFYQHNLK
jgi:hypothetical protein